MCIISIYSFQIHVLPKKKTLSYPKHMKNKSRNMKNAAKGVMMAWSPATIAIQINELLNWLSTSNGFVIMYSRSPSLPKKSLSIGWNTSDTLTPSSKSSLSYSFATHWGKWTCPSTIGRLLVNVRSSRQSCTRLRRRCCKGLLSCPMMDKPNPTITNSVKRKKNSRPLPHWTIDCNSAFFFKLDSSSQICSQPFLGLQRVEAGPQLEENNL